MKKIFLIFIMMLSVSSIFSAPKVEPSSFSVDIEKEAREHREWREKCIREFESRVPEEKRQKNLNKQDENMLEFYKSKGENVLFLSIEEVNALDEYKTYQKACEIKNKIKDIKAKGYLKIDENTGDIYTFYDFEKVEALENELNNLNVKYKKHIKAFEDGYYFVFLENN